MFQTSHLRSPYWPWHQRLLQGASRGKWYLETKIWTSDVLTAIELLLF